MGIRNLNPEEWFQIGEDYSEHLQERRRLLETRHDEVFQALPGSEEACQEIMTTLADHLPKHHPTHFKRQDQQLITMENQACWDLQNPVKHPPSSAPGFGSRKICV